MAYSIGARLQHGWNAFKNKDPTNYPNSRDFGYASSTRQDRVHLHVTNERSIIISVYNRIALDVSSVLIQHVKLDQNGRFESVVNDDLNHCLTVEANIDQTSRSFIQDIVMSMFDEGAVAVVPVDTTINPRLSNAYDIQTMRTGRIVGWYPQHVRVKLYNDNTGVHQELVFPKSMVAIIENPLFSVMNEPNSTLKRLIKKLAILDAIDEQSGAGKLDIIIQLPYVIKSEEKRKQAEQRRKDIELQLSGTKYGIAYTDGTERITQLNRPAENNLMAQIQYLTSMLYSQLGLTEDVFTGKANEETMLNYDNRTIEPIVSAIVDEFKRKFLTKTARTQNHSIMFFRDTFKLVPAKDMAEIADKYTRNEILSSNEVRAIVGYKPSSDPKAEELRNKNLNASPDEQSAMKPSDDAKTEGDSNQNGRKV